MRRFIWFLLILSAAYDSAAQIDSTFRKSFFLNGSLPVFNSYYLVLSDSSLTKNGFLGIAAEVGYQYRPTGSLTMKAGYLISHNYPIALPKPRGDYENVWTAFLSLTHSHHGRFLFKTRYELGYGMHYASYEYDSYMADSLQSTFTTWRKRTIGLSTFGRVYILPRLFVTLSYNPSLWNINKGQWEYNHFCSVEIGMKIFDLKLGPKPHASNDIF